MPGADSSQWGTILNDFLSVEHNADGSLKRAFAPAGEVTRASVAESAIMNSFALNSIIVPRSDFTRDVTPFITNVPANTFVRMYKVPDSKMATPQIALAYNTTGSTVSVSTYIMTNDSTPTDPADRFGLVNVASNPGGYTGIVTLPFLAAGTSVWVRTSVTGLTLSMPMNVFTIPGGQRLLPLVIKDIPTIDILLAQATSTDYIGSLSAAGVMHNTTASPITYTVSVQHMGLSTGTGVGAGVADSTPVVIFSATIAANSSASFMGGGANPALITMENGDRVYIRASAAGLNLLNWYAAYTKS